MADFLSFEPLLEAWLRRLRPERIVEWGPGHSTAVMLSVCPGAQILSIEHDAAWAAKAEARFGDRAKIVRLDARKKKSKYAYVALGHGPFDLAFVDGRRRVECCLAAMQRLAEGGVVILHDADRAQYWRPLAGLIEVVEDAGHTLVFRPAFERNGT